jgi:hypothetical protein
MAATARVPRHRLANIPVDAEVKGIIAAAVLGELPIHRAYVRESTEAEQAAPSADRSVEWCDSLDASKYRRSVAWCEALGQ